MNLLENVLLQGERNKELQFKWREDHWVVKTAKGNGIYRTEVFEIVGGNYTNWYDEYFNVFMCRPYYDNHFCGRFINAYSQGGDDESEGDIRFDIVNGMIINEYLMTHYRIDNRTTYNAIDVVVIVNNEIISGSESCLMLQKSESCKAL
jgi:hypothetical protein